MGGGGVSKKQKPLQAYCQIMPTLDAWQAALYSKTRDKCFTSLMYILQSNAKQQANLINVLVQTSRYTEAVTKLGV